MNEQTLFAEALERTKPEERAAFLDQACRGDPAVRQRIERLLAQHEHAGSFLEAPAQSPVATIDQPGIERPGTVIGPYKLIEEIGEGGMGTVWMAEQSEPIQRRVAVKVVKDGMDSKQVLARFEAEWQALALMEHPNIAKVFDAGRTPSGRPYFVMELVKGQPITKYCDEKRLGLRERLGLFGEVCRAVQHAHQKGIIHRDIKPSNVLVAPYDGKPVVKVIDFGVAKATGQRLTNKTLLTGIGALVGTPEYMSPEQAEVNNQDIDTRTDIYSLGVLLYELLTGSAPLTGKRAKEAALLEVLRVIREEEPPRPSTRLSESKDSLPSISAQRQTEPGKLTKLVRGELDWIVMKALEKDRSRRDETANGFAMDVQRYLADEAVQACPPSAGYRFRKFARRNRVVLLMSAPGACVLAAAVVGLAISNVLITREKNQKDDALRDKEAALGEKDQALALAKTHLQEAERQKILAQANASEASRQSQLALERQRLAEKAEPTARRRFYAAQMNLAHQAWEARQPARVLELLEGQRPKVGQEDLRTFEWYYLWRLCKTGCRLRLRGHTGTVWSVAFSPDSKTLASASEDGTVKLWDMATGQERATLRHSDFSRAVAFSPDGKTLASVNNGAIVTLWDVAAGQKQTSLEGDQNGLRSVAFSPDGKALAAGTGFGTVGLWDVARRQQRATLRGHSGPVISVAFSPDSKTLATGSGWGEGPNKWDGLTRLWDLTVEPVRSRVQLPNGYAIAFSPDGETLAVGGGSATHLKLYDRRTAKERADFQAPVGGASTLAFSPDGKVLASADDDDRTVRLWDVATGPDHRRLANLGAVISLAISADGQTLASGGEDGVRLWDLEGRPDQTTLQHPAGLKFLAFSSDGKRLISAGQQIKFWDEATEQAYGDPATERLCLAVSPDRLAFSADGKLSASWDGAAVKLWDLARGQMQAIISGKPGVWVRTLAFSPDARTLATGSDESLQLWDVATQRVQTTLATPGQVRVVAFSSDGKHLAAGGVFAWVQLWTAATGQPRGTLLRAGESIWTHTNALAFSPDSKTLASGNTRGAVQLWDINSAQPQASLEGHTNAIWCLAFFPDGKTLATGSADRSIKLWDVATGQERVTLKGHKASILSLAIAPDGNLLASGTEDGIVKLWRAASNPEATALKPDPDPVSRNNLAWLLATHPDPNLRNPGRAVELAKEAVALAPNQALIWNTLGVAQYRAGNWKKAIEALTKSMELQRGALESLDTFFLAMAHWQLGEKAKARQWHDKAVQWMEKNDPKNVELRRFRAEAGELLQMKENK
jgi:WD40 repeat protein/serine/threonine protein kinase